MRTKQYACRVKGKSTDDGVFTALVATWDVDSYGDKIVPGAFAKSLREWDERGDSIPIIWSHQAADPFAHVGHVVEARETSAGLEVRGALDLDNPTAVQVYRLLKGRRVTQFSFAFDVVDSRPAERDGQSVTELHELKLYEVGPCLVGVNQQTELLSVKAPRFGELRTGPLITPQSLAAWAALKSLETT